MKGVFKNPKKAKLSSKCRQYHHPECSRVAKKTQNCQCWCHV